MPDVRLHQTPDAERRPDGAAVEPRRRRPSRAVEPDPHALDANARGDARAGSEPSWATPWSAPPTSTAMPVVRRAPRALARTRPRSPRAPDCDYLSFVAGIDWMPAPKVSGDDGGGDTSTPAQPSEKTYGVAGSDGRFQVFATRAVDRASTGAHASRPTSTTADPLAQSGCRSTPAPTGTSASAGRCTASASTATPAAPPVPAGRVRGPPAAQGLPAPRARGEALAGPRRRRADARSGDDARHGGGGIVTSGTERRPDAARFEIDPASPGSSRRRR